MLERMQKLVIDTNVFVSALIQRSYPYLIINELFVEGKIELCISDALLEEYYAVFNRRSSLNILTFLKKRRYLQPTLSRSLPNLFQRKNYQLFPTKTIINYWNLLTNVKLIFLSRETPTPLQSKSINGQKL